MLAEGDQVKVLDFGLSRQMSEEAPADMGEKTVSPSASGAGAPEDDATRALPDGSGPAPVSTSLESLTTAGTIMGTIGYMSPEQARGEVATAASDMYSLGLMLQELFTGKPSYEPGLRASDRLEKARRGDTLPVVGLDVDLATLIGRLKSLEPSARPSAVDAAEKLEWIRRRPQRRRRRVLLAAAITALVLFGAAMTVQSIRATRAEKRARQEAETAKQVSGFLVDLFKISDPSEARGRTITAREILDQGSKKIESGLKDQPIVRARLLFTVGRVYDDMGLYQEAEPLLASALSLCESHLPADDTSIADCEDALATLRWRKGR